MATSEDKIEIRAGSRERITFTLYSDGVIVNLTDYSIAKLYMEDQVDKTTNIVYSTGDAVPILAFDGDKTTGKIHLDPAADTFDNTDTSFACYLEITHNSTTKTYPFREDDEFIIVIRDNFAD